MKVEFTKQAQKELAKLDKIIQRQVASSIRKIQADEVIPKKLTTVQEWKIRAGDYRIILEVDFDAHQAFVLRVQHRRKVYRTLRDHFQSYDGSCSCEEWSTGNAVGKEIL